MEVEEASADKPCTTYSINNEDHKFHVDNLRDSVEDSYESSVASTRIENTIKCINPFLTKCFSDSQSGPGINYFKFLRNKKIDTMKERGIHTNCEYHYVLQTSFYWKKIVNKVSNRDELEKHDHPHNILVVIEIPTTSSITKQKYDVYAKIIEK